MTRREIRGTLIIDGRCGFCAWSADLLARLDRRGRVTIVPSQAPGVLAHHGLTAEQAAASVWFVPAGTGVAGAARGGGGAARGGAARAGAGAVGAALDGALGTRVFGRIATAPGIGAGLERCYRWIAAHRSRLPGATPWCERDARCGTGSPGRGGD